MKRTINIKQLQIIIAKRKTQIMKRLVKIEEKLKYLKSESVVNDFANYTRIINTNAEHMMLNKTLIELLHLNSFLEFYKNFDGEKTFSVSNPYIDILNEIIE